MNNRITPPNITTLQPHQIFVFGSNVSGRHGKGAAKTAMQWGAKWGKGEGLYGKTYAIPTKNAAITRTFTIENIMGYVRKFIAIAEATPQLTFLVTEIGCGLAGLTPKQVAPLFEDAMVLDNVYLPKRFWDILND